MTVIAGLGGSDSIPLRWVHDCHSIRPSTVVAMHVSNSLELLCKGLARIFRCNKQRAEELIPACLSDMFRMDLRRREIVTPPLLLLKSKPQNECGVIQHAAPYGVSKSVVTPCAFLPKG